MMKLECEPVKGQTFDIGRTINFTKCNCEKCDFMHCDNYAKKMKPKKFKNEKEFVESWKEQNPKLVERALLEDSYFEELVDDFLDSVISFPKGLYWKPNYSWSRKEELLSIDICRMSKTKYERENEGDFIAIANVCFNEDHNGAKNHAFVEIYPYYTDRAEKLAHKIANGLNKVFDVLRGK